VVQIASHDHGRRMVKVRQSGGGEEALELQGALGAGESEVEVEERDGALMTARADAQVCPNRTPALPTTDGEVDLFDVADGVPAQDGVAVATDRKAMLWAERDVLHAERLGQ